MRLLHHTVEKDGFCGLFSPIEENRNAKLLEKNTAPSFHSSPGLVSAKLFTLLLQIQKILIQACFKVSDYDEDDIRQINA